jgi:hypothetical protein
MLIAARSFARCVRDWVRPKYLACLSTLFGEPVERRHVDWVKVGKNLLEIG